MITVAARSAMALAAVLMLSSCANTIRGMGKDVHQTKHAAQNAAN